MAFACGQDQVISRSWKRPSFWQKRRVFAKSSARPTRSPIPTGCASTSQATEEPKIKGARTPTLRLSIAAHEIPHPAKASYGGEDAFFITQQGSAAFGVADGVGGWVSSGINPAEYSKSLMQEAKAHFEDATLATPPDEAASSLSSASSDSSSDSSAASRTSNSSAAATQAASTSNDGDAVSKSSASQTDARDSSPGSTSQIDHTAAVLADSKRNPQTALAAAHKATKQPGSSTALVLQLREESSTLRASNLGDSGFAHFRNNKLIFQSSPLQHFFDCPYQFASCPDFTEDTDRPEDASDYELQLQSGDVIVAATDGLWDNLHIQELLPLLPSSQEEVEQAANQIANAASNNAFNEQYASPYTVEAMRQGMDLPWWEKLAGARFKDGKLQLARLTGGKLDDITVVVAFVTSSSA